MADTRLYALSILEILKTYSDEDHILSSTEIINLLNLLYQIKIDRRTVINNIEALITFGIDIDTYQNNRKGYFYKDRLLEDSEIHLLCNCIHSAHFIPEKASNDLIKKICSHQSKYKSNDFEKSIFISNSRKTKNKELLLNIDILLEAINRKKVITLDYFTYDYNKNLVAKRESKYKLHPYSIIQENDNLYLWCIKDNYDDFSFYRIDKMKNIRISEIPTKAIPANVDPYSFSKASKFMFVGDVETIYLRCHNRMLDDIIDQFGQTITINKDLKSDNYFYVRIKSTTQGIIYFALQYINYCKIIEPTYLREQLKKILQEKLDAY